MKRVHATLLPGAALIAILTLAGCSAPAPVVDPAPSTEATTAPETETSTDVEDFHESLWIGEDSTGLTTSFQFHADGTLAVGFGDEAYDDPGDTWTLADDGSLEMIVYLDETNGSVVYLGTISNFSDDIDLNGVVSGTGETFTLSITRLQ